MTHWTTVQQRRLCELLDAAEADPSTTWIGYWCSDAHGYPASGGARNVRALPGAIHEASGPLRDKCGRGQLHATRQAHRWPGSRVWIVALLGERYGDNTKSWALRREIIGEVLPEEAILDAGAAARLGAWHVGADLARADLGGANLGGADLRGASLARAYLGDWERGPDGYARRRSENPCC